MIKIETASEQQTIKLGEAISHAAHAGSVLCLIGELGSGKTTFVKGIGQALKIRKSSVHSPTFTLLNIYEGKIPLYHFDLYRLDNPREIINIGYDEFINGNGIAVIEWADKLGDLYPKECLEIHLKHKSPNERLIEIKAKGDRYKTFIKEIKK